MTEHPGYRFIGRSFILSTSTIKDLCSMAEYFTSKDELNQAILLRPELYDRVYNVLQNIISSVPLSKNEEEKHK